MNMNRIKTLCAVFAVVLTGVFVAKGDGMENIPYLAWDEDAQGFVEETCDYAEVVTPEMVKRMMDKVTYNYVDGRNVLVVGRKRI